MGIKFNLEEAISILAKTPDVLSGQLTGLSENWLERNEGGKTWNPKQVLGHLVFGEETDWLPRIKIILEHGTEKEFTPFDRFAQDRLFGDKSTEELLRLFTKKRKRNLEELKALNLTDFDLQKKGLHPELGEITLQQMLSAWVVHDLGHIVQVNRVLAKNYSEEIGPWEKYLTIVRSDPPKEK